MQNDENRCGSRYHWIWLDWMNGMKPKAGPNCPPPWCYGDFEPWNSPKLRGLTRWLLQIHLRQIIIVHCSLANSSPFSHTFKADLEAALVQYLRLPCHIMIAFYVGCKFDSSCCSGALLVSRPNSRLVGRGVASASAMGDKAKSLFDTFKAAFTAEPCDLAKCEDLLGQLKLLLFSGSAVLSGTGGNYTGATSCSRNTRTCMLPINSQKRSPSFWEACVTTQDVLRQATGLATLRAEIYHLGFVLVESFSLWPHRRIPHRVGAHSGGWSRKHVHQTACAVGSAMWWKATMPRS